MNIKTTNDKRPSHDVNKTIPEDIREREAGMLSAYHDGTSDAQSKENANLPLARCAER